MPTIFCGVMRNDDDDDDNFWCKFGGLLFLRGCNFQKFMVHVYIQR